MNTTQCTDKHTYTVTGPSGETLGTTKNGPKLAWAVWTNAGADALDMTATHPDGTLCPAETRAARALLPCGPYATRRDARIDGQPLREAVRAVDPDDEATSETAEAAHEARRRAAADYVTGRLRHLGVGLGAYDEHVAAWVSGWEPEVVAVILGWTERARAAGRDSMVGQ